MRVRTPGIGAPQDRGSLRFEGRAVPVAASDTIASAMVADGERGNRIDETGARRGVWCGMGVCHECTVRIDGDGGSLACMTPARVGAVIEPQPARRSTPTTRADERPETELTPDVLVIGAGPAGTGPRGPGSRWRSDCARATPAPTPSPTTSPSCGPRWPSCPVTNGGAGQARAC